MKAIAIALALGTAWTAAANAQDMPAFEGPAFESAVRDYLLANPELLLEMQSALEAKRNAEVSERQAVTLEQRGDRIFDNPADLVLGNPDGDVTVVEFYDYNCGVCRRALSDMQNLIESDSDIRFVLKEWPILGPPSMEAHLVSRAVARVAPDRYGEFHLAMLGADERADGDTAMAMVERMGIDEEAVQTAMNEPETTGPLEEAYELAEALGIGGTPSYVVGGDVLYGAVGVEALKERIAAVRSGETRKQ